MEEQQNADFNFISGAFTGRFFYKAPVCRLVMYGSIGGYLLINFGAKKLQQYLQCNYENVVMKREIWRLFISKLFYTDAKYLVLSIFLLFNFKVFERRFGSRRFASCLLAVLFLTQLQELFLLISAHKLDFGLQDLPTGPLSVLFSLLVPFYLDIPRITRATLLGVPITGKALVYICGLQIASSSKETLLLSGIGLVAGCLFRANFCNIKDWMVIPAPFSSLCYKFLAPIFDVSPPSLPAQYGATLELQRIEEANRLEQAMILSHLRRQRTGPNRPQNVHRANPFRGVAGWLGQDAGLNDEHAGAVGGGSTQDQQHHHHQTNTVPSEELIGTLTSMGFSRESVLEALALTGNDINEATNYLLMAN